SVNTTPGALTIGYKIGPKSLQTTRTGHASMRADACDQNAMNQRPRPSAGQPCPALPSLVPALALLLCCGTAGAQTSATDDERSWSLGLALGHGQRDNPLINGESIAIHAVIDFSWYGERFFFDNGDFGYLLAEDH